MATGLVGQHQITTFTSPVNGTTPIDANTVRGNDNTIKTSYDAHDNDTTIHLQCSTLAARPAASTAGQKWMTSDGFRLYYDDGAAWHEAAYLPTAGGTVSGDVTITGQLTVNGAVGGVAAFAGQFHNHVMLAVGYYASGSNPNILGETHQVAVYASIQGNDAARGAGSFVSGFETAIGTASTSGTVQDINNFEIGSIGTAGATIARTRGIALHEETVGTANAFIADQTDAFTGQWFIKYVGTRASSLGGALTVVGAFAGSSTGVFSSTLQASALGVGTGALSQAGIALNTTALSGVTQFGIVNQAVFGSAAVTGYNTYAQLQTTAAAFTLTNGYGVYVANAIKGAASAITNMYGIYVENVTAGGTLNYALKLNGGRVALSLPTSSAGLASGDTYSNAGVVTVVP